MSNTTLLTDILKSLPTASDTSGKSVMLVEGNGNPSKVAEGMLTSRFFGCNGLTDKDDLNKVRPGVYGWLNGYMPENGYGANGLCISLANGRGDTLQIGIDANTRKLAYRIGVLVGNSAYESWTGWRELQSN